MPVVGFSFSKFSAERNRSVEGKLRINYNLSIKNIEKKDLPMGAVKHAGLRFTMELNVSYADDKGDDVGTILTQGEVFLLEEEGAQKEILDNWKKGKKIDKDVMKQVFSASQNRSSVQAIIMSRDIGLPPPIQLPNIQFQ